jgi:hypothetical protein
MFPSIQREWLPNLVSFKDERLIGLLTPTTLQLPKQSFAKMIAKNTIEMLSYTCRQYEQNNIVLTVDETVKGGTAKK